LPFAVCHLPFDFNETLCPAKKLITTVPGKKSWNRSLNLVCVSSFPLCTPKYRDQEKVAQVCNLRGLDRAAPFVVNKGFFSDDRPQVTNLRYFSFS
jgi:hypothetical protein